MCYDVVTYEEDGRVHSGFYFITEGSFEMVNVPSLSYVNRQKISTHLR